MGLALLEIGQADQLSACRLSLLLGVFTPHNQVEGFLNLARKMLSAEKALLFFHDEPYLWHAAPNQFHAVRAQPDTTLAPFFAGQFMMDESHPRYADFCTYLRQLGVIHQRALAIDLQKADHGSIGQVVFFDEQPHRFSAEQKQLVSEFSASLVPYLTLKFEHAELQDLYEQQRALNFSKTKFLQVIAHDLRAPFHGLLGFSEVLAQERETLDEPAIQNIADYLHDTTQSTYNLLEGLLNWAMAEGGRFVYHPISFNLKQVSNIVCSVLNSLAVRKNIQLIDQVPDELKVFADINMITSVVQNLVSNALKFTHMDGSGKVVISARQREQQVEIMIQDTGLGMTEAQLAKLFEPQIAVSFQGTAGEKGTGLGLVLCKRFIDLNHGEIRVTSKEGEGSLFTVLLPAVQESAQCLNDEQSSQNQIDPSVKMA